MNISKGGRMMNYKYKFKQILAALLSIAMLSGILPMHVFAADITLNEFGHNLASELLVPGTTEETLPKLEFKLYSKDEDAGTYTPISKEEAMTKTSGEYPMIYIALIAKNFDQFANNAVEKGLYSLVYYIKYNSQYIDIDDGFGIPSGSDMLTSIKNSGITSAGIWNRYDQTIDGIRYRKNAYTLGTNDSDKGNNIHQVDIKIMSAGDTPTNSFPWANEECVFLAPIKIIGEPTDPTAVFSIDKASIAPFPVQATFNTASGTTSASFNASDTHMEYILKIDNSQVNFFPPSYTVTYKNGDAIVSTEEVDEDSTAKNIPDGTTLTAPEGQVFDDWYFDLNEGGAPGEDGTVEVIEMPFTDKYPITKDLTVYAKFEAGNTITFKANYPADATITADDKAVVISKDAGTTIPTDKQPKVSNDANADFGIPEGYVFDGWYDAAGDGANKVDLTTATFTADTDLYAHWTKAAKINFYKNDGVTTDSLKEVIITPGETIPEADMPADPTRDGYVFKEWNTESNGSGTKLESTTTFNANQDLYAIWTADGADQVTLHFDPVLEGVTATPDSVTVNKGDAIYTANIPVVAKDGYSFDGWFKTAAVTATDIVDFSGEGYILPADKTEETVYAHWTYTGEDAVNVKFMKEADDSEDYVDYITVPVKPGTSLGASMPANPTKSGKTFTAWTANQDGSGDKFTGEITINEAMTVYAQYAADVTINYDANTGSDAPASVTKPAPDAYADPTTTPTKDGYTFIGWNTKKSGGGEYIAAGTKDDGTDLTYGDIGALLDSENKLYAQWAAVKDPNKDDVIEDNPVNPDPDKQGAVVTFDENVSASTTDPITSNVSPAHKYPKLGETLASMGGLPEAPARNDYDFLGWNTQPDGSGTPFDENTTVDKATLGDDITIAEDGTGSVTVYAQWKLADDYTGDRIKLTFSKNEDGTGSDTYKEIELVKGDALGYVPTVANDGFNFNGWFGGTVTDGKVVFDENDEFDPDATFDADKTYYAQWQQYLVVVPTRVKEAGTEGIGNPISDGIVYANKEYTILYNVYTATIDDSSESETGFIQGDLKNDNNNQPLENVDLTAENSPISVGYTNTTDSSTILKTAGVYTILPETTAGSYLEDWGCEVLMSYPESVEITPALVTVLVDPDTQIRKKSDTDRAIGITYSGFLDGEPADKGAATATVNYRQWTPADASDTTIETSELDTATTVVPTAIAKYVVEVNIGDTNYKVGSVDSSKESADEKVYPREADDNYPGYGAVYEEVDDGTGTMVWTLTKPGENIYYEIQVSDPSIKTVKVTSEKTGETPTELGLKTPDYTADQTFETGETPTVKDYGVRVTDTEAETVKIEVELTNPDTTTITATVKKPGANEGDDPIDSPLTITPAKDSEGNDIPGKYIVEVPLDNKGKDTNDVTITTKAGDGADAPSIDYTFKVQQFVKAEIRLNYGNSPYGEIMKAANIAEADKAAAKTAFNVNNKYDASYMPDGLASKANIKFTPEAWVGAYSKDEAGNPTDSEIISKIENSDINLDRNDYAIFAYERTEFDDTGFTAVNSLGEDITDQVVRSIEIKRIRNGNINYEPVLTGDDSDVETIEFAANSGNDLSKITQEKEAGTGESSVRFVRPNQYELKYTVKDIDGTTDIEVTRKIVVLPNLGDVNFVDGVNSNDAASIYAHDKGVQLIVSLPSEKALENLFMYRVGDVNFVDGVNSNDAASIYAHDKGVQTIVDHYKVTK